MHSLERQVWPGGSTNFHAAFDHAWRSFSATSTSSCNRLLMFLSDGEPTEWSSASFEEAR